MNKITKFISVSFAIITCMMMHGVELQIPNEKNKEATQGLIKYFEGIRKDAQVFDIEVLQPLFEKGADANIKVRDMTLLQYATQWDEADMPASIIDFLVQHGADVNQRTPAPTSTRFSTAMALAKPEKAEKLMQHGLKLELLSREELATYQKAIDYLKTLRAYQEFRRGMLGLEPLRGAGTLQWHTNAKGTKIYDGIINPELRQLPLELIERIGSHLGISEPEYFPREKEKDEGAANLQEIKAFLADGGKD